MLETAMAMANTPAESYPLESRATKTVTSHWQIRYVNDPKEFQIMFRLIDKLIAGILSSKRPLVRGRFEIGP